MTNRGLVDLVMILDRSGSMASNAKIDEAVNGFNELVKQQRELPGHANVTLVIFDNEIDTIYDRVDMDLVQPLTKDVCYARGRTALLDAIGATIDCVGKKLASLPEEERPHKVIFAIATDGMENASKQYHLSQVRSMIEHQENKYQWHFMFSGAGIDAFTSAVALNIPMAATYSVSNDGDGMKRAMSIVSQTTASSRTSGS